jgi:type I restriction enzyme R subunit
MRSVKSRNFFEQMKGRGVRVIRDSDFQAVTPDAKTKDHFVIVDCVGVCESPLSESRPLERDPTVPFETLMKQVAFGNTSHDIVSSLASRLARMNRQLGKQEQKRIQDLAGGVPLQTIVSGIVDALDPDRHIEEARAAEKLPQSAQPPEVATAKAADKLIREALAPLAANPKLRNEILELKKKYEQTIDNLSRDLVLEAGFSADAKDKAKGLVASFEKFIADNKDEITALQVLYSRPYKQRLRFEDIKALADAIEAPPRSWTPEKLWAAYEALDKAKVKHASGPRLLTDIVALVRFAIHRDDKLVPFAEKVDERFQQWLLQQENKGQRFTAEQREWLVDIKNHIASSFGIEKDDFEDVPFNQRGGLGKVYALFGERLEPLVRELNEVLVA